MCGNAAGKEGAACIAGKLLLPTLSSATNPKHALACTGISCHMRTVVQAGVEVVESHVRVRGKGGKRREQGLLTMLYVIAFSILTMVGYIVPTYSRLLKIKVLLMSKPQAMMSRVFSLPSL